MESVVEFILEDLMHINNAIGEYDEKDSEEGSESSIKKAFAFNCTVKKPPHLTCIPFSPIQRTLFMNEDWKNEFIPDLTPPPPKG